MKSVIVLRNYLCQTDCPQEFVDCEEMDGSITKGHWQELVINNSPLSKVRDPRY